MRDVELKYNIMEQQAYALVRTLKSFRVYILHSKILTYVPDTVVKEILIQPDSDGKRSRLIVKILEYDLEIKPTKLVKEQGITMILTKGNCKILGVNSIFPNLICEESHN